MSERTDPTPLPPARRRPPWRLIGWSAAAVLVAIPWLAMQVTDEVDWTAFDFVFFGGLLALGGLAFEGIARVSSHPAYRAGAALAILGAFLLIMVNGAVGIIGTEDNPANRMYLAILAILVAGAGAVRLRARGMTIVLALAAGAQAVIAFVAVAGRLGAEDPNWPVDTLGASSLFIGLWLVSAWLFARAARA